MDHPPPGTNKYDPNPIIQAANDKFQNENDIAASQMIFQSALFDWTDDAPEGLMGENADSSAEAIATLWIAYSNFLANAKQYKSAMEALEQAVTECSVAPATLGRLYLEYARFAEERNKLKLAQDLYIRALVRKTETGQKGAVQDAQDRTLLWNEFLEMMRKKDPDLTMEALKAAVEEKEQQNEPEEAAETPNKRVKREEGGTSETKPDSDIIMADVTNTAGKTHVVLAESIEAEATKLVKEWQGDTVKAVEDKKSLLPADTMAAWMVRDGNEPPQQPDPPLFQPSPPKLSDPTAKDILGVDMAQKLIERLLSPSGNLVLQVCHGLWTLQALKHKETSNALEMLDEQMLEEHKQLESNLQARLSVATAGSLQAAVEQMNENERQSFQATCSAKRQKLLGEIAWEFRHLLYIQQAALIQLDVPGFSEPTVNASALKLQAKVCLYLHSAFYIRNHMGIDPHESMLKSLLKRLEKEPRDQLPPPDDPMPASPAIQSTNSGTNNQSPMPPSYNYPPPLQPIMGQYPPQQYPPQYQQQQQPQVMYAGQAYQQQQQPPPPIMMNAPGGLTLPPPPPPPPPPQMMYVTQSLQQPPPPQQQQQPQQQYPYYHQQQ